MKKFLILTGLIFLGSLSFSGCGGGISGQPLTASTANFVLGQMNTSLQTLPTSNTVPSLPITGVSLASRPLNLLALACETITPNPTVDADNDGIAATKKYTYDCTDAVNGANLLTRKGYVEVTDLDETKAGVFGGVKVDFNVPLSQSTESGGSVYNYSYMGQWLYKNVDGNLVSTSNFTGLSKYKAHGLENDYTYTSTWNYKMTPDNGGAPWTSGKIDMNGTYEISGKFARDDGGGNHLQESGAWVISYRSDNLVFNNACAKFFQSGSYIMEDTSNKIEIRYACTTAKLFVNGAESTWWTP